MDKTDEHKAKLDLLGGIIDDQNTTYDPKIGNLLTPLPLGAAIWVFCGNCGAQFGIPKNTAKKLAKLHKFTLPADQDLKMYVYIIESCGKYCHKDLQGREEVELRLIKITDLA